MKWFALLLLAFLFASCAPSTPEARIAEDPASFANLSDAHQNLVRQGRITSGMSQKAVELAWGQPSTRYQGEEGSVPTSRWDYNGSRPVFVTYDDFGFYGGPRYAGRYGYGYGPYPYSRYGYAQSTDVQYVNYHKASVWFRQGKVSRWETAPR